jgi:hypothetical protein
MPTPVRIDDLEDALMWTSSIENDALLSRSTGRIYFRGPDGPVDPDFPEDIEDGAEYIAIPHKNELELGRSLVLRFVDEHAPHLADEVYDIFRHKGAYARLEVLLQRVRLLDRWHEYEQRATSKALERWAVENGFSPERGASS